MARNNDRYRRGRGPERYERTERERYDERIDEHLGGEEERARAGRWLEREAWDLDHVPLERFTPSELEDPRGPSTWRHGRAGGVWLEREDTGAGNLGGVPRMDAGYGLNRGYRGGPDWDPARFRRGGYPGERVMGNFGYRDERPPEGERPYGGYGLAGDRRGPRPAGRGPKNYTRSDQRIREDICDRLMEGWAEAEDVEVQVRDGEVYLTGTVAERQSRYILEDLCDQVLGVKDVHNQLRVRRPEEQPQPARPAEPRDGTPEPPRPDGARA